MTTTLFYNPTTLTNVQVPNEVTGTPSIDWNIKNNTIVENNSAVSKKPLYTISGLWMEKFLSNTSQLWCTNFKIPTFTGTVTGIELQLNVKRAARIEDLIIQLTKDGTTLAGDNYASTVNPVESSMYTGDFTTPVDPVGDSHIYGGPTDLWGTTWASNEISASTFGVVISFKSNLIYPHSDLMYVDLAAIRVTYA
jgi:hypothetical protein